MILVYLVEVFGKLKFWQGWLLFFLVWKAAQIVIQSVNNLREPKKIMVNWCCVSKVRRFGPSSS
jgi:D-alanyl-lipoteichoic acid acyltransferase DltB (MBOAT superfamily)